jgi:coenzyme Q-binding protein COQ10
VVFRRDCRSGVIGILFAASLQAAKQRLAMPSFRTNKRLPFTPRQMFDLVADVERYPQFLPLCEDLVVRSRETRDGRDILVADMTAGYQAIRETFRSRVELDPAALTVDAVGVPNSPGPFSAIENRWRFATAPEGCEVEFFIAYEFKSMMLQMLVGALFERAFRRYVRAFEERAEQIYGRAAAASATS